MPLTRVALNELLDTLQEHLAERLVGTHLDPLEMALWLERCLEVIRGFAAPEDGDYLEARLLDTLPREVSSEEC